MLLRFTDLYNQGVVPATFLKALTNFSFTIHIELKRVCFTVSVIFVVHNFPSVLIDKENITLARSHALRFEPVSQLLSNVMKQD